MNDQPKYIIHIIASHMDCATIIKFSNTSKKYRKIVYDYMDNNMIYIYKNINQLYNLQDRMYAFKKILLPDSTICNKNLSLYIFPNITHIYFSKGYQNLTGCLKNSFPNKTHLIIRDYYSYIDDMLLNNNIVVVCDNNIMDKHKYIKLREEHDNFNKVIYRFHQTSELY